jgi:hypothetical protein
MVRPSSLTAKGQGGYTTRAQSKASNAASAKSADESPSDVSSDESLSPPRPKHRRASAAKSNYQESTDDDDSEQESSKPPSRNEMAEGQFDHYFGDEAIGDPEEDLIEEYEDDVAVEKLESTKKPYTKILKQERFKDVLVMKRSFVLGRNPPISIAEIYDTWGVTAKKNWKNWDIATIAKPMYLLGKYLARRISQGDIQMSDETVPICSLFALYKHFSSEAGQEIEKKKAQTRKILSKASSTKSAKKDKLILRHITSEVPKICVTKSG